MQRSGDRVMTGIVLMLGFCLFAPLIDVSSKLATATVSVGIITLGRYVVQGALMAPVLYLGRFPGGMSRRGAQLVFWRSLASVLSTLTFVRAVAVMPIADALAIAFVEPFIILLAGRIFFAEQVGPRRIAACAVGFAGALLVIQPSFSEFGLVALLPVGTAISFAAYMMITREASLHVAPEAMQFHTAWMSALICLPLLAAGGLWQIADLAPVLPQGIAWAWVAGVGVAATVSHLMMTYAFRFAASSVLAPLHYLEIVSAATLAWAVFGDFPDLLTWCGIGVIVASGLYIIYREHVVSRGLKARPAAAPAAE
ncbi:DMT family transporter [Falsigemmobacter intermedius]|uniref:DMT family transporter n=1 Tax=Falsigemmobacter intermedius TaxID=1553448 RepID=A0A444MFF3_9RHOB|nr:DMT family transporter [Falsigemmobacter intermedius]RWY44249.1 DMT family transporter [Falsigemmobacter intermedius]